MDTCTSSVSKPHFQLADSIPIKSAYKVPSPSSFHLPGRPQPSGSEGDPITLYTNHFKCYLGENIPLYQFDVSVEQLNQSSEWYVIKGRVRCATIVAALIENKKFDSAVVWYDEQKCLYSTRELTTRRSLYSQDKRNRLNINCLIKQHSTKDIQDYIRGAHREYPHDAVRILETLLKKSLGNLECVVSNACYFKDEPATILPGDWLEERYGFLQSLYLFSGQLTLNIQTKLTTFYRSMDLLDFIHVQLKSKRLPTDDEYKILSHILQDCQVVTQQSDYKRIYEIQRFDKRRPEEIYLDETRENLVEYYKNKKNIVLKQGGYRWVEVYRLNDYSKPCHLPLEVCLIVPWQVYDKKVEHCQQCHKNILSAEQRYKVIMKTLAKCNYNAENNILCQTVGFRIDDKEMSSVQGRVLSHPVIETGRNQQSNVRPGRIPSDECFVTAKLIKKLAIAFFGTMTDKKAATMKAFSIKLDETMKKFGIKPAIGKYDVDANQDKVVDFFRRIQPLQYELIVCVMDSGPNMNSAELNHIIKKCGTIDFGIMTQCALWSKIDEITQLDNYCKNLLRKINVRMNGINTRVQINVVLKNQKPAKDKFMIFGADVIHPTNCTRTHPSIAAVVGSGDSLCSFSAVRVCKQYPLEGKCSIEIIKGLQMMIEELLIFYSNNNENMLPNKIVFYRDGVDDGQFGKIIMYEISAIKEAFKVVYGQMNQSLPQLAFIIVKKRHHTRFFTYDPEAPIQTGNIGIGSVVDTSIVHPYQHNFFLNSHQVYHGVNKPSLYHVLLDEIGFTSDEVQLLTYHLCYTDPSSSMVEAIPSVVHQADTAALKARDLFFSDASSSETPDDMRSQPLTDPTPDNIVFELLRVHPDLKDRPVFC